MICSIPVILYYGVAQPARRKRTWSPREGASVDTETVRTLIALNNRFYAEHAVSFSATRNAPWAGWMRLADALNHLGWSDAGVGARSVLDLACGNLRFERFLADALPSLDLHFEAMDSCPALSDHADMPGVSFQQLDILAALLNSPHVTMPPKHTYDLSACFGFMHHVPSEDLRRRVLDTMVDAAAHGGFVVLSFWQFMNDDRLAAKAKLAGMPAGLSPATLDTGDRFLGWQDDARPLRYCHHFSESEIDSLVAHVQPRVRELERWSADGVSGTLNRYLLLQRS